MTWVKICGMTNPEDAHAAADAGADAVGFVFYEKSSRLVSVEKARDIAEQLPKNVEKVGVFAGQSMEYAIEIASYARFDAVQLYLMTFGKPLDQITLHRRATGSGLKMYVALPISLFLGDAAHNFSSLGQSQGAIDALFLDSGGAEQPGGTGQTFDWQVSADAVGELKRSHNVVVAGGLTPENVGSAIRILHPWGVDVASGVEVRPGKKDPDRVRAFVRTARQMEQKA
jgi:phosphoribosylanthranilate isomerase